MLLAKENRMKFIDLFAGLGGFHVGLSKHGHECVFACELDTDLRQLYELNHGLLPKGDIRNICAKDIPAHNVLCAGFPCQPFSLAGKKKGAQCPESGKLIEYVIEITKYHLPQYVLLENVPNILTIQNGVFWQHIKNSFNNIGYHLSHSVFSPVDFGIPQNRKRVFVVAIRNDIDIKKFEWPKPTGLRENRLATLLESDTSCKKLEPAKKNLLGVWQELLYALNIKKMPSISIVAPEFGATYPLDYSCLSLHEIKQYRGAYGATLADCTTWEEVENCMPAYTKTSHAVPEWIKKSIQFSRILYSNNIEFCDNWKKKINKQYNSWQILEWRGDRFNLKINSHLVQFRASGVRIMRSDIAPSLISMTPTQIPIIPVKSRYLSPKEAAKLQYLDSLKYLPKEPQRAFKALGNAVNARIVELISENLGALTTA